jgi:tetratricopeptide (TPR) repeat protein
LITLGLMLFTAAVAPRAAAGAPQAGPAPKGAAPAPKGSAPAPKDPAPAPKDTAPPTTPAAPASPAAPAPPASPAAPPGPDAGAATSPEDRAAKLYAEGNALYDQGKHTQAEAKYQAAWDLRKSFDVAGNLGNVEVQVGQHRDAVEHLTYALQTFPLGEKPEKRKFLEKRLAEAKQQIGTLRIAVNIDGAEILIDGKPIGQSPLPGEVYVEPGERVIDVRRGRLVATESILVAKGSSQNVAVTLESGPKKAILIAGGAVGAAGLLSGVVFAIVSTGKAGDADAKHDELAAGPGGQGACTLSQNQASCNDLLALREDQALFANVSVWSFILGGAALAGTAVYWVMSTYEPTPTPTRGFHAVPVVTAKGGGLVLGGSF